MIICDFSSVCNFDDQDNHAYEQKQVHFVFISIDSFY